MIWRNTVASRGGEAVAVSIVDERERERERERARASELERERRNEQKKGSRVKLWVFWSLWKVGGGILVARYYRDSGYIYSKNCRPKNLSFLSIRLL